MQCHQKQIQASWLLNTDDYLKHLNDAFILMHLSEQKHIARGHDRSELDIQIQDLAENEIKQIQQEEELNILISKDEELREHVMFKIGSAFGSVLQRNCIIEKNIVSQVNKGGQVDKKFGVPSNVEIQDKQEANKARPWDQGNQQNLSRIVFSFQKHHPIWIYQKSKEDSQRWINYLQSHKIIANMGDSIKNILEQTGLLYRESLAMIMSKKSSQFAIKTAEQRKKAAQLAKREKQFLMEMDSRYLKVLLMKKWLNYSMLIKRKDDQIQQMEDAERTRMEQRRIEMELKREDQKKFLLSKSLLNIDIGDILRRLMSDWIECSEEVMYHQQVQNFVFSINFKSLNVDESIYLIKPIFQVELVSQKVKGETQSKSSKQYAKDEQLIHYKLKLEAFLSQQRTDKYYNWTLREHVFENFTGTKLGSKERKLNFINIADLQAQDCIQIQFKDNINAFYDSVTEPQKINIKDILGNAQEGRSIWVPMRLTQTNPLKTESKQSMIFLELDIHITPSSIMKDPTSFEEELDYICDKNLPYIDPLYDGLLKLPPFNDEIIKVVMQLIEENTNCMRQSLQMFSYMIYLSNQSQATLQKYYHSMKVYTIRKALEIICHNFCHIEQQVTQYQLTLQKVPNLMFLNIKNPQIAIIVKDMFIKGIPYYARNRIWLHMFKVEFTNIETILDKFHVYLEDRVNQSEMIDGLTLPSTIWLYLRLMKEKSTTLKNLVVMVDEFLKQEDAHHGIINESFYHMLKNVLVTFLLYQHKLNLSPNQQFIQHLFVIAKKLLSMQCYHYIQFQQPLPFLIDGEVQSITDISQQTIEIFCEGNTFWLLVGLSQSILNDYPFFEQNLSQTIFLEDCAFLRVYLNKNHKELFNKMYLLGIDVENVLYEAYFNLYSDIFQSEMLYRVWDIIIFQQLNSLAITSERGFVLAAIMATLICRLEHKTSYISDHMSFLGALKMEAILIFKPDEFIKEVLLKMTEVAKAVKTERDEEGPLHLGVLDIPTIDITVRKLDLLDEKKPKASQQMKVYQYLSLVDF